MPSLSPLSSLDKTYSIANVFVTKVLIALLIALFLRLRLETGQPASLRGRLP